MQVGDAIDDRHQVGLRSMTCENSTHLRLGT
jgi:hypothetical protein